MNAGAAHRLDAEVEGGRVSPSAIVDDERDTFAGEVLRHGAVVPRRREDLRPIDDRQDRACAEIVELNAIPDGIARHRRASRTRGQKILKIASASTA